MHLMVVKNLCPVLFFVVGILTLQYLIQFAHRLLLGSLILRKPNNSFASHIILSHELVKLKIVQRSRGRWKGFDES